MNFISLNQIFLPVKELNETKKWYIEHFNMVNTWEGIVGQQKMIELSFLTTSFWLVEHKYLNKYTHIPFNFHTNQINEMHKNLKDKGITVTDITANGECFDFYDPEGNRIGFCFESYSSNKRHLEVGGTFLTVKNLLKSVQWYRERLDYDFEFFQATGEAGVIGPTLDFMPELTIEYGNIRKKSVKPEWSRMSLVETPDFYPRAYKSYNLISSNIEEDYEELRSKSVKVSALIVQEDPKRFSLYDLDGNEIEIIGR